MLCCVVKIGGEKPIPLHENVMQKHAAFFDKNQDGVIYPWETFQGYFFFPFNLIFRVLVALL